MMRMRKLRKFSSFIRREASQKDQAQSYLSSILNATVYDVCIETPMQRARGLSAELENEIYLKREDMQPVFSFKLRGAYNKLKRLVDSGNYPDAGVVACSAGNHAQGVAFSANELDVKATIVMPLATPKIKVNSVKALGGDNVDVRLFGNNFDFAAEEAQRLVNEENMAIVHPFDDRDVISGQGMYCSHISRRRSRENLSLSLISL